MKYRADIDGLRTVAVVPVVVYHAGLGLSGGFVGVDVFFVISGFLITYLLANEIDNRQFSLLRFYERRARRLFPALFTMLAATTVAAMLIMVPFDLSDYSKSLVATTMFAANIWFYSQEGYFTEAAELEPLLHTWSLGVEEQYYIIFPLLLFALSRLFGAGRTFAVILLLAVGSFVAAVVTLSVAPEAAFYLPHLRAWELLIGSLLALAVWRGWWDASRLPPWLAQGLALAGLAAILWPVLAYSTETPFPGLAALPPCLGAATLIAVGAGNSSLVTRFLSLPVMVFIGKLSYSLYLWHWPVISLTYYHFGALTPTLGLLCLAASFALSYLSWRYVERPVRNRQRIGDRKIVAGSATAIVLSIGIGLTIWQLDGLPNRMDPELMAMADSRNFLHDRRDCHFVTPQRARAGEVCIRGAEGVDPSFVLIGDSHADALSPAIFAAAADLGLAGYQYTDAGFVPLPGVWPLGQRETDEVEALTAFLEARPDLRTLIVARYWQHQMTGYTYRHAGDVWVDAEYDGSGTRYNGVATRNGIARLAARFPDRQIVLLDDFPSGSELHMRDQLRHMRLGEARAEMGLPTQERDAQRASYEPVLADLAAELPNLHYKPVFQSLCGPERCALFDGDTLLFRDGDHLSWDGALRLKAPFSTLLSTLPPAGH